MKSVDRQNNLIFNKKSLFITNKRKPKYIIKRLFINKSTQFNSDI